MAGVALGNIDLHFAWQAWYLAAWTFTAPGATCFMPNAIHDQSCVLQSISTISNDVQPQNAEMYIQIQRSLPSPSWRPIRSWTLACSPPPKQHLLFFGCVVLLPPWCLHSLAPQPQVLLTHESWLLAGFKNEIEKYIKGNQSRGRETLEPCKPWKPKPWNLRSL